MLGIHRLTSTRADYYLADLAQELPLPGRLNDGPAYWIGHAAAGLGLAGVPDRASLRAVLDGRHPAAGHRLRSDRATVGGFDLTFSAPKSVSVVFALGGEDVARHVVAAHRASVHGARWPTSRPTPSVRRGDRARSVMSCRPRDSSRHRSPTGSTAISTRTSTPTS